LGRRRRTAGGSSKTVGTERFNFWGTEYRKQSQKLPPISSLAWPGTLGPEDPTQTACPKQVLCLTPGAKVAVAVKGDSP
jgi:hypothetical protein